MAARINETYSRMVGWLDRRRFRRDGYKPNSPIASAPDPADDRPRRIGSALSAAVQARALQLYAAALTVAVAYTMFRRRR